nr:hypothetical protein [Tanacetum cinerariifolium]
IICDLNKTPDLFQEPPHTCPKCGNPVDGQYCQGCALLRKKFKEDIFTYYIENGIFQDFQDTSEPSNDNTNVVNALQEAIHQFEDFSYSNDDFTLIDDDSFSIDNIEYVDASPPDSELFSSEVMEILIPKVGGIDADILLTIKDDILREKLLNINLLIANIEALKDNPTPYHVKEISSGSTTTHSDFSLYDSFIFDLSINLFSPADRSEFYHEEFVDELAHIISLPKYDCFCFKNEPNSRDFTMDVVEDIFPIREPRVYAQDSVNKN